MKERTIVRLIIVIGAALSVAGLVLVADNRRVETWEKPKYEVGDVVQLKSGGPEMVIEKRRSGRYYCRWFWIDCKAESAYFDEAILMEVESDE
jgi:uncharacterized protein YodC (DUF2158 family)